jgi:hypothetical protein
MLVGRLWESGVLLCSDFRLRSREMVEAVL